MTQSKSITLICFTRLSEDSRLQRHVKFFEKEGFRINLVSLSDPGREIQPNAITLHELDFMLDNLWHPPASDEAWGRPSSSGMAKLKKIWRYACLAFGQKTRGWLLKYHSRRFAPIDQVEEVFARIEPTNIVMANDWNTLTFASRLIEEWEAVGIYDSHEYATEEFADIWDWKIFMRPLIRETERRFISDFQIVTTVSHSIALAMTKLYCLSDPVGLLRNIPLSNGLEESQKRKKKAPKTASKFLYLGAIAPRRGLEKLVQSLPYWRSDQTLTFIGPQQDPVFAERLREQAHAAGMSDRFEILPPVKSSDVVRVASAYDAGLIILPTTIKQNQWAMPNKFFEYMMAGLAIISTPLADLSRIISNHGLGIVIPTNKSEEIGAEISKIEQVTLKSAGKASKKYMSNLSWTHDYEILLDRVDKALSRGTLN